MNSPVTSRMESLSVLCALVLTGSVQVIHAVERGPTPQAGNMKLLSTGNSAPGTKRSPRSARGTKASFSAATLGREGAKSLPLAPRVEQERDEIAALKERIDRQESLLIAQQQRIARLEAAFDELKRQPTRFLEASSERTPEPQPAAVRSQVKLPVVRNGDPMENPPALLSADATLPHPNYIASLASTSPTSLAPSASAGQAGQETTEPYKTRLDILSERVEGISKGIAGFRFSGDLRLRADSIFRSSNAAESPVQNVRGQYRARLNLDKGITSQLDVHFQLGSGRFDNALTDDTDFGGGAVRGPLFLTEAWVHYHPNSILSIRGGKMPEVFQDYTRFIWDEDVRFNGFQESLGKSPEDNLLGITRIDFRAGQYVLTSPNIQVLPSAQQCTSRPLTIPSVPATLTLPASAPAPCAYLQAGYKPGEKVRDADLFDQGLFVVGRIKPGWSHYLYSNLLLYRNPNQIALGSTPSGLPLLINPETGVTLAGPLTGTGSATTMPGGGIYTASHFQIGHVAYRLTKEGWNFRNEEFPVFIDFQASRNFGTSFLRNAWMATFNAGEVKRAGDVRFLYLYALKEGNSMVSQFTDDHIGTLTGVNIRTHAFRFDLGLAKFLQWQNIFYIQNEISRNDPARHFYVPLPQGTPTQYRLESSIFVNF